MHQIASLPPTCQGQITPWALYQSPHDHALLARIEEKALRLETRNQRTPFDRRRSPLVCNSIKEPTTATQWQYLPEWCYVPTEPAPYYEVYRKDVIVHRCFPTVPPPEKPGGTRAEIYEFSQKSKANLRHVCNNSGHHVKSQFCLTYHEQQPTDGHEVKAHLKAFIRKLRSLYGKTMTYLWVLEFQTENEKINRRESPHFHIFLNVPPNREHQRTLAQTWVDITEGSEQQFRFHVHPKNWHAWNMDSAGYVLKEYAIKEAQKEVPEHYRNVGRFWGCSRNMIPVPTIVEPDAIARFADHWTAPQLNRFFDRVLRRYQERQWNRDRKTGQKRKQRKRKSPLTWQQGEMNGAFRVAFAATIFNQLLNYVATNPPPVDRGDRRRDDQPPF